MPELEPEQMVTVTINLSRFQLEEMIQSVRLIQKYTGKPEEAEYTDEQAAKLTDAEISDLVVADMSSLVNTVSSLPRVELLKFITGAANLAALCKEGIEKV